MRKHLDPFNPAPENVQCEPLRVSGGDQGLHREQRRSFSSRTRLPCLSTGFVFTHRRQPFLYKRALEGPDSTKSSMEPQQSMPRDPAQAQPNAPEGSRQSAFQDRVRPTRLYPLHVQGVHDALETGNRPPFLRGRPLPRLRLIPEQREVTNIEDEVLRSSRGQARQAVNPESEPRQGSDGLATEALRKSRMLRNFIDMRLDNVLNRPMFLSSNYQQRPGEESYDIHGRVFNPRKDALDALEKEIRKLLPGRFPQSYATRMRRMLYLYENLPNWIDDVVKQLQQMPADVTARRGGILQKRDEEVKGWKATRKTSISKAKKLSMNPHIPSCPHVSFRLLRDVAGVKLQNLILRPFADTPLGKTVIGSAVTVGGAGAIAGAVASGVGGIKQGFYPKAAPSQNTTNVTYVTGNVTVMGGTLQNGAQRG